MKPSTYKTIILAGRFIGGIPMRGRENMRTNATAFRRGDKILHRTGRAGKWAHLSHIERAAIRISILTLTIGLIAGYHFERTLTIVLGSLTITTLAALLISTKGRKTWRNFRNHRVARPLPIAIASIVGTTEKDAGMRMRITPNHKKLLPGQQAVRMTLPPGFHATEPQKEAIEGLLERRLGIDLNFIWKTDAEIPYFSAKRAPQMPKMIPLPTVLDEIHSLPVGQVLLGKTAQNTSRNWDMISEDPMMMVQTKTRRGKTSLLLLICAQAKFQGAEYIFIIDPKNVGVDEALGGIDGIQIHNDITDIEGSWQLVHEMHDIMQKRIAEYRSDRTIKFQRAILAIDELPQWAAMTQMHWRANHGKGIAPVWEELRSIEYMGAQFGINVLVFGQRIDYAILQGTIGNFGTRLLAGYNKNDFARLVEAGTFIPSRKERGRFIYYDGESPVYIQTIFGEMNELRELAMSDRESLNIKVGPNVNIVED